jgi:hypothetical protein
MADPQSDDAFDDEEDGGGESTVSMASPTLDSSMPLPISIPPPTMQHGGPPNLSIPTAPAPFPPNSPGGFPQQGRGMSPHPPPAPPKPLPAAGAAPMGAIPGMKRPQTVIGLAPPPVGAPRPGQAGARMPPLPPTGGKPAAPQVAPLAPVTPRPGEKGPPSSGRGVRAPASSQKPLGKPRDADSTDEQLALPEDMPDSHKEDGATMMKSSEESLALFGLDSGLTNAARAAVAPKAAPARSPLASTKLGEPGKVPPPIPAAGIPANVPNLAVLHDRNEEEESTRAVSREEMLRNQVVIGDEEDAGGNEATLAVGPGFNEAAAKDINAALAGHGSPLGAPIPTPVASPSPLLAPDGSFPPVPGQQRPPHPPPPFQQPPPPQQTAPNPPWQDPNAGYNQPPPQQPGGWTPNPPQSYPGMQAGQPIGPVSGPHMPVAPLQYSQVPQSQPHMQVPPSANMPTANANLPGGPIPYPGNQMAPHQQPNPFGDWNANAPAPMIRKKSKVSGQIILLGIVGVVCLAIFVTGIILFMTTKF